MVFGEEFEEALEIIYFVSINFKPKLIFFYKI